jgi:hypothetical protein
LAWFLWNRLGVENRLKFSNERTLSFPQSLKTFKHFLKEDFPSWGHLNNLIVSVMASPSGSDAGRGYPYVKDMLPINNEIYSWNVRQFFALVNVDKWKTENTLKARRLQTLFHF